METVKRPRIKRDALSELVSDWVTIDDVLVDTDADFCVLPKYIGETLVKDITTGNLPLTKIPLSAQYCPP